MTEFPSRERLVEVMALSLRGIIGCPFKVGEHPESDRLWNRYAKTALQALLNEAIKPEYRDLLYAKLEEMQDKGAKP